MSPRRRHSGPASTLNPGRLAEFGDWSQTLTPRPLPRTLVPLPREVRLDYLARLARANHIEVDELAAALRDPDYADRFNPTLRELDRHQQRLAAAAGQPIERITRLDWRRFRRTRWNPDGFRSDRLRPACWRCVVRRGAHGPIDCNLADDDTVCLRHRLWIGPGVTDPADQYDLAPFPEYVTAARRHQRRERRGHSIHHRRLLTRARLRVHEQFLHSPTPAQLRRLEHFVPDFDAAIDRRGPAIDAVTYPEWVRASSATGTARNDHPISTLSARR